MIANWKWQNDCLWQSCSAEARAKADGWCRQPGHWFAALRATASQQPLTDIAHQPDRLTHVKGHAAALASLSTRLVVIGTGGASLGAQALCRLAEKPRSVLFLENCDPSTLAMFFRFDKAATSWCIISKSGETVETLAAALALIAHYAGDVSLAARVRVITAVPTSSLGQLATLQGWPILAHPERLGGRFSVFSEVGLLPAAFAGLDIDAIAATAAATMQQLLHDEDETLFAHTSWMAANAVEKPMHVLMAYADRLRPATQWFKQLLAESVGKNAVGLTPVTAIGAIDQHSQLQLYLDGPRDKLVTLWLPQVAGAGALLPAVSIESLAYLAGHTMGDVMQATSEATATTLMKAGIAMRVARGTLTPETLASWFARQMLEVLMVSILFGVDPYSQPAVEEGKHLTRAALAKRG
jgi:glucose-6-phosphate isomerase